MSNSAMKVMQDLPIVNPSPKSLQQQARLAEHAPLLLA